MKKIISGVLSIIMVMLVAVVSAATANADNFGYTPGVEVLYVKVNGEEVSDNQTIRTYLERDQELDITVKLRSYVNLQNVEISAFISGYEYNEEDERMSDVKVLPETEANVEYLVRLKVKVPALVEKDDYKLRVSIADRYSALAVFNYNLKINAPEHEVKIKDVILSSEKIKAGRSLIANVRLKNIGAYDEEDIKITAKVKELDDVKDVYYMDKLEADETKTSEDLLLRIPMNAKPGRYTLQVKVEYNNDHSKVSDEVDFEVLQGDTQASTTSTTDTTSSQPSTPTTSSQPSAQPTSSQQSTPTTPADNVLINYDSNSKVLTQGEGGAIYSITIANQGTSAKSFVIDASGVDWATIRMSPGNLVVVNPGETKAVYIYASAKDDAEIGTHEFSAVIRSGNNVVGTAHFKADVIESAEKFNKTAFSTILTYMLIAFVILLAIAVIVLAVKKGRDNSKKEETEFDATQSYY